MLVLISLVTLLVVPAAYGFQKPTLSSTPPRLHLWLLQSKQFISTEELPTTSLSSSRRDLLHTTIGSLLLLPTLANAADTKVSIVPPKEVFRRLRRIPTFCIVDGGGTPFMTYNKDTAAATGYFFTSYAAATNVLEDAKKSFQEARDSGKENVQDAWGESRIVMIPLDYVMQLSFQQTSAKAQNDKTFRTFYEVIPLADDLETALRLENSARYQQRGRVPLFYFEGLELPPEEGSTEPRVPVYFNEYDLIAEWRRQNPGKRPPNMKVKEFNETFRAMTKPGGTDESVKNLVFVPSPEALKVARELTQVQGSPVYKLGEIILTG